VVFELTSSAEGSADAHAKLEDKKRLVITELEKVGLEGLKIVASGVSLSVGAPETEQDAMNRLIVFGQESNETEDIELYVTQTLTVTLNGGENLNLRMGKLLDAAVKLQVVPKVGPTPNPYAGWLGVVATPGQTIGLPPEPPSLRFEPKDPLKSEKDAMAKAFQSAKEQAQVMAEIAGVELGLPIEVKTHLGPRWSLSGDAAFEHRVEVHVRFATGKAK
jgi:uncharacterized protein YggE